MPTGERTFSDRRAWLPDLTYTNGEFVSGLALVCRNDGRIDSIVSERDLDCEVIRLSGKAILPGLVNAHSHAFQRVMRGRTEFRTAMRDSFWTWRNSMYQVANRLSPDDIYAASRLAFLEMALSGITTVGEFHYLHNEPDGSRYADPNLLAKVVISAAKSVGIRIALLRVAYVRAGFGLEPNAQQARFIETDPQLFLKSMDDLCSELTNRADSWVGVAPHSVRAVPFDFLKQVASYAEKQDLPIHIHVAEQPAELEACRAEYGWTPVELLNSAGILSHRFTAVHAIHISESEISQLAQTRATVCACPTTERNLGDGVVPADKLFAQGVSIALGSDSQTQIDLLEDARELEYHLRLTTGQRAVLDPGEGAPRALAARLFECATSAGATSLGFDGGILAAGKPADFFSIDTQDPSIVGAPTNSLLPEIVFSAGRAAIRDVVVNGRMIVKDGSHQLAPRILEDFEALQKKLWT